MSQPNDRAPVLLHPGFVGAGAILLIAAFITDVMYYRTSLMQWANFSAWLIVAGLLLALLAAIFLIVDFAIGHARRISWLDFVLVAVAALLSLLNAFIHSRDAWTSVVPQGILISGIVTILLVVVGFRGWTVTALRPPVVGERP